MPAYSLGTMGAWAVTTHTAQMITGSKTFQQPTGSGVSITLNSTDGNGNPLLEWYGPDGVRDGWISSTTGSLLVTGTGYIASSDGDGEARLNTASAQYGMLQLFNNTSPGVAGSLIGRILNYGYSSTGVLRGMAEVRSYLETVTNAAEWANLRLYSVSAGTLSEQVRFGDSYAATWIWSRATTQRGLVVRGAAGQSANLQEWQNSAGTVMSGVDSSGRLYYGPGGDFSSAALGSYQGKMAVNINGTTRYIPYYT